MDNLFCWLLIVCGMLIMCINNSRTRMIGAFCVIVGASLIAAFRPTTSADTATYQTYYKYSENIKEYSFALGRNYYAWVEDWYINFCSLFSKNDVSFQQYLFIMSFLIYSIGYYSLYKITEIYIQKFTSTHGTMVISIPVLSILFTSNYGFLYSYVVIRGGLAFVLCLLAIYFSMKRKNVGCIICITLATILHNYSIIILLIILFMHKTLIKMTLKRSVIIFTILLLCAIIRIDVILTNQFVNDFSFLFKNSFFNQFGHYLLDAEMTTEIKKSTILFLVQSLYITYLFRNEISKNEMLSRTLFIIAFGSTLTTFINDNATVRIANFFMIYQLILFLYYLASRRNQMKKNCIVLNNGNHLTVSKEYFINAILIIGVFPTLNMVYILRYCSII